METRFLPVSPGMLHHGHESPLEETMTVKDILAKRGWASVTVDGSAPVSAVIRVMRRECATALAVSTDGRSLDGLITEREIMAGFRMNCVEGLMDMAARSVMSRNVPTCAPDEDLRVVMTRLAKRRARHVAVLDGHRFWGIVSMADIIQHRLEKAEREVLGATRLYLVAS